MLEIKDLGSLRAQVGQEIAVSDWVVVTQQMIQQFADATDDQQWIHTDPARAAAESPFGTTIAHGFLTLSLLSALVRSALRFEGLRLAVNCGLNRVRFVSPVPAGSRVRARITPASVGEIAGTIQVIWNVTIEREGGDKPACVAEWIVRYFA
ncbi:MAG TPA: MaoC family dehydratase [Rhodanobacteraceae bacterium]